MTWTRSEIRSARLVPLVPVLQRLGYRLEPAGGDNYRLRLPHPAKVIVIKDHYWRCPDDGSAGNSIDFFMKIQGLTFHHAMQLLLPS